MKPESQSLARHLATSVIDPGVTRIIVAFATAGTRLAEMIARAALSGAGGYAGERNATGDNQKKLDILANDLVVECLAATGLVAAVVSEELAEPALLRHDAAAAFIVCTDPLDGSSNTDINGAVGTIFGVYRRTRREIGKEDLLRRGIEQVAAGYVMYGTSTLLVYTAGIGAHGFTLDRSRNDFVLSHPDIRCPANGRYFSANLGNLAEWPAPIRRYFDHVTGHNHPAGRPFSLRDAGALVADVHRNLLDGGVYFYPADATNPDGKLRYLYESAPLAFVIEQAGGRASTGSERILDRRPGSIHERTPLVIGSAGDVEMLERFVGAGLSAPA